MDFLSLSPKLSNSNPLKSKLYKNHEQKRINYSVISKFLLDAKNNERVDYQLKFVIKYLNDHLEILTILDELKKRYGLHIPASKILLMPEGRTSEEIHSKYISLTKVCMKYGFRLTPRLHIDIWGNKRGI